ncbi:short-chain dehydrogenase/reductase SDR [Nautilia profundicola AmH]|uniref:Short-chain dehydrogenase/reductase SDR n=1 Tax=Nautilia profundicola (strain ATCC BAA-1463 / DSM 18972 / AmH) TaxID=598659 RepID=B9L5S0_NAUPA|nr:SDR family NAD(P)-dependent oxidoreductase [Nautilia profundicola]ACM93572.1 short-chain dehydrogenase/reductase SDR [Nautilia profundicola AmH]
MNILITGASRGIGRELVNRFDNGINKIYAVARNVEGLEGMDNIIPVSLDLADIQSVREYFKNLDVKFDIVIANAAISLPHSPSFTPFEDFKKTFDVNFLSIHAMLEGVVSKMEKGKIVLISSLASLVGAPSSMPYSASKRALNSYAQSLRNLLAPDIKVINILPGFIKTDMTDKNDFYMPFLMDLKSGVDRIMYAIESNKKEYAFPKRFYYLIKLFNLLPLSIQDKLLQKVSK